MRDYTREALSLLQGRSRVDLDRERLLNLGLVRLCELIGEAASKVPSEFQEQYPQIPWRRIVGFRNRVIHDYDTIDLDIVWQVLTVDLPPLAAMLDDILS
jgi:uncharacterized protein with HEPN domain